MSDNPSGNMGNTKRQQPESLRAKSLGASLTVKDLGKSVAWYRDVVGFTVDQNMERDGKLLGVALKAGQVRILLNQDDGGKGWDRVKGEGFSLQFTTSQNIDELAKRITDHGHALERPPTDMPWGVRLFTVRDLDGYKLAFSSERPAQA